MTVTISLHSSKTAGSAQWCTWCKLHYGEYMKLVGDEWHYPCIQLCGCHVLVQSSGNWTFNCCCCVSAASCNFLRYGTTCLCKMISLMIWSLTRFLIAAAAATGQAFASSKYASLLFSCIENMYTNPCTCIGILEAPASTMLYNTNKRATNFPFPFFLPDSLL